MFSIRYVSNPVFAPGILALFALAGVVAARRGGLFRKLLTALNIVDLTCSLMAYAGMYLLIGVHPAVLFSDFGFLCRSGLVLAGVTLAVLLAFGKPVWNGFGALLPVRGLHARRLLAGIAILGMMSPWLEIIKNYMWMDGVKNAQALLLGVWWFLGAFLCLLPLCETLARAEPRKVTA